ncbi:hypothetical protein [Ferruginibacter sp. HRS2-29]|uniref:hypothetical protein n=1 Tax=Ferruginibacter sp. HRS2-29 TaxID=2487334 RepID=UPI0020CC6577|nr:hypothetical protein [Ferruginibacter sp. HRS2-29]MCP9749416.1 hypothetical protein [Ferruginibacter sp. HRS2-29]
MLQSFSFFKRFPGGENEGGGAASKNQAAQSTDSTSDKTPKEGEKGFIDKVKDALQDWSNEDQAEQDLDDRTP